MRINKIALALKQTQQSSDVITNQVQESWRVVPLHEITIRGNQIDAKTPQDWKFKYVDVSSVSNITLEIEGHSEYVLSEAPSRAKRIIQEGDVIFATIRPSLKRIAFVSKEYDGHVCSTAFCVIRAKRDIVDPEFLFYAVSNDNFVKRVSSHETGVSYPAITEGTIFHETILLPPMEEQRKIIKILSSIRRGQMATQEIINAMKSIKESYLRNNLQNVIKNDSINIIDPEITSDAINEGWSVGSIEDFFEFTRKPYRYNFNETTTVAFLPMDKIPVCKLFVNEYIMKSGNELNSGTYFEEGDLLVARITPSFENGKQAIAINLPNKKGIGTTEIIPIRGVQGKSETMYLHYYLLQPDIRNYLATKMSGTTGRQRFDRSALSKLLIILPPLSIQKYITKILQIFDEKLNVEYHYLQALRNLYLSLQEKILRGNVPISTREE